MWNEDDAMEFVMKFDIFVPSCRRRREQNASQLMESI